MLSEVRFMRLLLIGHYLTCWFFNELKENSHLKPMAKLALCVSKFMQSEKKPVTYVSLFTITCFMSL